MKSIELIRNFLTARQGIETAKVVPEALLADLGVDSLMMLELIFEFEDRFGIKLPADLKAKLDELTHVWRAVDADR